MERLLGIDYGKKRIGLAVSDLLGMAAHPLCVIVRKSLKDDLERIETAVSGKNVSKIIIGLPLNMDGTEGTLTGEVKGFAGKLGGKMNLPVEYCDERLTTHETERFLIEEADMSREKRKQIKDKLAACMILQNYMDRKSNNG